MNGSFAATLRKRARRAAAVSEAARRGDDVDEPRPAAAKWEHVPRMTRAHGVPIGPDETGPDGAVL